MTNIEMIKSWGFFEKDGWLCSPKLNGEAVFQIEKVDEWSMSYIIEVLQAVSFNAGSRWQRAESKTQLVSRFKSFIRKIEKE